MPTAICKTCSAEFDATLRCPECRQIVKTDDEPTAVMVAAGVKEINHAVSHREMACAYKAMRAKAK